jgi:hypothetical protein
MHKRGDRGTQQSFAERFETLRVGRSLKALAADIQRETGRRITAQAMHKWLQGGGVTLEHIDVLARYFRVTRAWLLWGEEPQPEGGSSNAQTFEGFVAALPVDVAHSFVAFMQMLVESNKAHFHATDLERLRERLSALHSRSLARKLKPK